MYPGYRYRQTPPPTDPTVRQPDIQFNDLLQADASLRQEEAIKALSIRPPTPQPPPVVVPPIVQPPVPTPQFQPLVDAAIQAFEDSTRPFIARDRHEATVLVKILQHLEENEIEAARAIDLSRLQTLLLARATDWGYAHQVERYQQAQATGLFTLPPYPPQRPHYGLARVQRRFGRVNRGRGRGRGATPLVMERFC